VICGSVPNIVTTPVEDQHFSCRMQMSRMEETDSWRSIPFPSEKREFNEGPIRQQRFTLFLAIFTAISMIFTIFFVYNSSLEQPFATKLIFERPERSIFVLNIASQITIFCLAELTTSVLEATRWAFACNDSGTPVFTFLALSRATSIIGVVCLLLGKGPKPATLQRDGHRLWGSQRYVFLRYSSLTKDYFSY
jgi:hypothetical protein